MKSLISLLLVGIFLLNFLMENSVTERSRYSDLEKSLQYVQAVMQVDTERVLISKKVLHVITRYNPDMPLSMKQGIIKEIHNMSIKYPNLDVDLICATITHESGRTWDPKVVSNAGAMGLMQIMPTTGLGLAKYERVPWTTSEEILFDPIYNIRMGTRYLSALIETYDLEGGLAAYNGGAKRAQMWLTNNKAEGILWAETRNYIPYVLKLYDEYKSFTL